MEAKDLRQKSPEELRNLAAELRVQLREAEFAVATHQLKKVRDLRRVKRDLARVLTTLNAMTKTDTRV